MCVMCVYTYIYIYIYREREIHTMCIPSICLANSFTMCLNCVIITVCFPDGPGTHEAGADIDRQFPNLNVKTSHDKQHYSQGEPLV